MIRFVFVIALLLLPAALYATNLTPDEQKRAENLYKEVRCPTCEGQSLHDSNTPLSQDIRTMIAEQIHTGESDQEILSNLKIGYGESILLRPEKHHWMLWSAPLFSLLVGGFIVLISIRNKKKQ